MKVSATAATVAPPSAIVKWSLRSRRSASRQGRRFMRGMSVEAPEREPSGGEERRGVALDRLRLRARGEPHLPQRIAALGRDAYAARDHVGNAWNVRAAAADEDLLRLLAPGPRSQIELQRAAHLLRHVVDEGVEDFRLIVPGQPAFLLRASGLLHREAVGAHDLLRQLLAAEREVARVHHFQILEHAERRAARAEIDDGDRAVDAAVR